MLFLDLAHEPASKGHVLSTDGSTGDEFTVEWSCKDKTVRWGEMWTRDKDFNQIERRPAPKKLDGWHSAKDTTERRIIEVACVKPSGRFALRSVKTNRQPIRATREALDAISKGTQPHVALFKSLGVN